MSANLNHRNRNLNKDLMGEIVFTIICFICLKFNGYAQESMNLSGKWEVKLDPMNIGIDEHWYLENFEDFLELPGSCQEQGFGNEISADMQWWDGPISGLWQTSPIYEKYRKDNNVKIYHWLQPEKYYLGAVWYTRDVLIPESWDGKNVLLFLERAHWLTTVYVNGKKIGSQSQLGTPHEYDITATLKKGVNKITMRIDNSEIVDIGGRAHSVSDQTQTTWNGVIGTIELQVKDPVFIQDIQVFPNIDDKNAKVLVTINSTIGNKVKGALTINCNSYNTPHPVFLESEERIETFHGEKVFEFVLNLEGKMQLWDEFNPSLYKLSVKIQSDEFVHKKETSFGMREIKVVDDKILVNGNQIHLRGNVDCAIFPINGYTKMNLEWWKDIFKIYKDWGFNHIRFHSWCPPKAAFVAADELGLYLAPEVGEWATIKTKVQQNFLTKESHDILKDYGNHPSFTMMALGNEHRCDIEMMKGFIADWKKDPRHIYTGKSSGGPVLDEYDFHVAGGINKKRLRYNMGWPPKPTSFKFNSLQPNTRFDYNDAFGDDKKVIISHETGQRCVYPDIVNQSPKYIGTMKGTWLDIAREQLEERGMSSLVNDFVMASGKWQLELYKEEIESNLRTTKLAGFQLLSLQDFTGQEGAPVGVLDAFYDTKGFATAEEFRTFCNSTVILAKMDKRTFLSSGNFSADIELYNYSGKSVKPKKILFQIVNSKGKTVFSKTTNPKEYPMSEISTIGDIEVDLKDFNTPEKYSLKVRIDDELKNSWNFWVYPDQLREDSEGDIMVAKEWNEATKLALEAGENVLLLLNKDQLKGHLESCFTPFFWTAFDLEGGASSAGGLLTDPNHPVFENFPTDAHGNWQWWELLTKASPMILDEFQRKNPWPKSYHPLIQMIPSWKLNRKLSVLTEARIGKGKLMICTMDIENDLENRKVARQFRYSLIKYMKSDHFRPVTEINYKMMEGILDNSEN